jgi:hypothetical protein
MISWLKRHWIVLVLVLVNSALASPVAAGLDDDWCLDPERGAVPCCTTCIIFCYCSL